ncbi:MAG: hypothetical protein V1784_02865 [bacterium]
MTFTENLEKGKAGESAIARWLISRGNSVLPVYEKIIEETKGPQLFTGGEGLIAPDLLSIHKGKILWVEAKHKAAFTWYRNAKPKPCFETGIDLRNYNDYINVAVATDVHVWLLFLHEGGQAKDSPPSPSGLYGNDLMILANNESHRSEKWGKHGMVYWTREEDGGPLKLIASLEEMKTT